MRRVLGSETAISQMRYHTAAVEQRGWTRRYGGALTKSQIPLKMNGLCGDQSVAGVGVFGA